MWWAVPACRTVALLRHFHRYDRLALVPIRPFSPRRRTSVNRSRFGVLTAALSAAAVSTVGVVAVPASAYALTQAPTKITELKIVTGAKYELTVSGKLTATGENVGPGERVTIETARPDHTGWTELPTYDGQHQPVTAAGGAFSGKYYVLYPHGYYRLRYGGNLMLAPSVSAEIRDPRVFAAVAGFKVSKRKIKKGSSVTFSGVLRHSPGDHGKWTPYAGQRVYIAARLTGESQWYWYARPKTDAHGRFKTSIKISKDGSWEWYYAGNATHYMNYLDKPVSIDVR